MTQYKVYLDVKAKSLAIEARIIRRESHLLQHRISRAADAPKEFDESKVPPALLDNPKWAAKWHARALRGTQRQRHYFDAERRARLNAALPGVPWSETDTWRFRRDGLDHHRRFVVRPEARSAHLARGFLRDVPYRAMEEKCHSFPGHPDWGRVLELVEKYGEDGVRELRQRFARWLDEARLDYNTTGVAEALSPKVDAEAKAYGEGKPATPDDDGTTVGSVFGRIASRIAELFGV